MGLTSMKIILICLYNACRRLFLVVFKCPGLFIVPLLRNSTLNGRLRSFCKTINVNGERFIPIYISKAQLKKNYDRHHNMYPYYDTAAHHHCEIITTDGRMMPPYVAQMILFGTTVFFTVLIIGIMMVLDRIRQTPVVRARAQDRTGAYPAEEMLKRALKVYNKS